MCVRYLLVYELASLRTRSNFKKFCQAFQLCTETCDDLNENSEECTETFEQCTALLMTQRKF